MFAFTVGLHGSLFITHLPVKPNYLASLRRHGNLTLPLLGLLWVMLLMAQDTTLALWSYAQGRSGVPDNHA